MVKGRASKEVVILRANPFSLGGAIFAGFLILTLTLFWIVTNQATPHPWLQIATSIFLFLFIIYSLDALSERLELDGTNLVFSSILRRKKHFDLCRYREVLIVHEGLNQERGIVSIVLASGEEEFRLPLGPFWRQRELENFLVQATKHLSSCQLLAPVR